MQELICPLCDHVLQTIAAGPGTRLTIRCMARRCTDRPLLTFEEDRGQMVIRALDRAPMRIVG